MKKLSIMFLLCMVLSLLPVAVSAAGVTKTINCGTFTIEISDVYGIDSASKSSGDGYTTMYFVVVTDAAEIKCTKYDAQYPNEYLIWPCTSIVFTNGPLYPAVKRACEYDYAKYVPFSQGTSVAVEEGNEYYFTGSTGGKNYGVRIFAVDAAKAASAGGVAPVAPAPATYEPAASEPNTFATSESDAPEPASSTPATLATHGATTSEPVSSAPATFDIPPSQSPETPAQPTGESVLQAADVPPTPPADVARVDGSGNSIVVWGIGAALVIGGNVAVTDARRRKRLTRSASPNKPKWCRYF